MSRKILLYISVPLLGILLIVTGVTAGMCISEYKAAEGTAQVTTTRIAVVNADTGIEKNGETINYASEFMSLPNDDFVLTGYTDGEQGLDYDKYAAMILIPSNFSSSIESINGIPEKTQIVYKLNPDLRADVRVKTSKDIHNFITQLSNNISYVYVEAILKEVHEVQDESENIMENDKKDLKKILDIQSDTLIGNNEFVPFEVIEKEIIPLELSDDYTRVGNDVEGLTSGYTRSVEKASEDLAQIKENESKLTEAMSNSMDSLADTNPFKDNDGISKATEDIAAKEEALNESLEKSKATASLTVSGNGVVLPYINVYTGEGSYEDVLSSNNVNVKPVGEPNNYVYDIQTLIYELARYFKEDGLDDVAGITNLSNDLDSITPENCIEQVEDNDSGNAGGEPGNTEPGNTVSGNTLSGNSLSGNSLSGNSLSGNSLSGNSLSGNSLSGNDLSGNNVPINPEKPKKSVLSDTGVKNLMNLTYDLGKLYDDALNNEERINNCISMYNLTTEDDADKIQGKIHERASNIRNLAGDCIGKQGSELESQLSLVYSELDKLNKDIDKLKGYAQGKIDKNGETISKEEAKKDLSNIWELLSKYRTESMKAVNEIKLDEDASKEMSDAIKGACEQISDSYTEGAKQYEKVCDEFSKAAEDLIKLLFEYDALKYLDNGHQNELLQDIFGIITDMEKNISEQDLEYMEYVLDVNKASMENTMNLQENMDDQNDETKKNIEEMVEDLKDSRTKINKENVEIFTHITSKLPYTRLGTIDYTQVYSMVSDPVEMQEESSAVTREYMDEVKVGLPTMLTVLASATLFMALMTLIGFLVYKSGANGKKAGK